MKKHLLVLILAICFIAGCSNFTETEAKERLDEKIKGKFEIVNVEKEKDGFLFLVTVKGEGMDHYFVTEDDIIKRELNNKE
ncbi:hypothetical protein ACOQFO_03080 [Ureibacillus sp. MALMAid1270]|uniref:hypothetical protein n=1 Tax=Ureibacillus sp. MALMAid1270 TaxID=3411629 RepID=UPI003BA5D652